MARPVQRKRLPSTMESSLAARDHVGVQDFVLLHDHKSEDEFIENLKKRFGNDLIYVSRSSFIEGDSLTFAVYYRVVTVQ